MQRAPVKYENENARLCHMKKEEDRGTCIDQRSSGPTYQMWLQFHIT